MKNLLLLILIASGNCFGQAYTFIPMDLDTTCFWVHTYYNYHSFGFNECSGEKITYVEKDTMIGLDKYFKLVTYTSAIGLSQPQAFCENAFFKNNYITYIKEDTSLHQIIDNNNKVLLDFNKNIGDTLNIDLNFNNPIVDSITIDSFNLIMRKVQWGNFSLINDYRTIEGIGATYNFPIREYGEWITPAYHLKCFSKNGQILYPNNSVDPCIKSPKVPVGIENYANSKFNYFLNGKKFSLVGSITFPIELVVYDLSGRILFREKINDNRQVDLSSILNTGLYLFSLSNSKNRSNRLEIIN